MRFVHRPAFTNLQHKSSSMRYFVLLLLCLLTHVSLAQFDRQSVTTRFTLTAGTGALTAGAFWLEHQVEPLSDQRILELREREFSGLAAFSVNSFDQGAAKASDVLLIATALLPATAFAFSDGRSDWLNAGHLYLQTGFLNYAVTNTVKSLVRRPRPYVYNPDVPAELLQKRDARMSFFSGHTSTAASFCFLTASMIQEYSNNKTVKTVGWIAAGVLPAVMGYLRMKAGKHFFSDVLVGYAAGAGIGIALPLLHRRSGDTTPR